MWMVGMTWKKVRLEKLLSQPIKNGYSPICSDIPTGRWVLGLGALNGNGLDVTQAKPAPVADKRVDEFLLQSGDFLVSRSNTLDKVGRSALFKGQIDNCSYPDLMMRFRVDVSKIHPEFLEIYLRSPRTVRHFQRSASGTSASMVKINKKAVEDLRVSIPPLFEQIAIADFLSTWDAAIEKIERLIAAKEKRLSSLIQRMISSRCENWEHLQTQKIFRTVSEKKNSHEELLSVTQDRGVIPRTMLNGRVMSPEGSVEGYKLIKKGDFAISLRSFQGGIEYSEYQGLISPAYTVLRSSLKIHDEFYRHFFKSYLFIEKYLSIAVIGIRDGKQISIPDVMTIKIPYPPMAEQEQIASTLNTARKEIDLLKKQLEVFHKQKRGLMQKLLSGEWRVKITGGVDQ
jgi:type I restriction enzyme S subunit